MGEIPVQLHRTALSPCMTRKPNKFAQNPNRKMKREINLPKNLPAMERDGLDFIAAIFARAHAENPDENWLSRTTPWVRAAVERRG